MLIHNTSYHELLTMYEPSITILMTIHDLCPSDAHTTIQELVRTNTCASMTHVRPLIVVAKVLIVPLKPFIVPIKLSMWIDILIMLIKILLLQNLNKAFDLIKAFYHIEITTLPIYLGICIYSPTTRYLLIEQLCQQRI